MSRWTANAVDSAECIGRETKLVMFSFSSQIKTQVIHFYSFRNHRLTVPVVLLHVLTCTGWKSHSTFPPAFMVQVWITGLYKAQTRWWRQKGIRHFNDHWQNTVALWKHYFHKRLCFCRQYLQAGLCYSAPLHVTGPQQPLQNYYCQRDITPCSCR